MSLSPEQKRALWVLLAACLVVLMAMWGKRDGIEEEMVLPPPPAVPRDSLPHVLTDSAGHRVIQFTTELSPETLVVHDTVEVP